MRAVETREHAVVVVGAGPTGLMLAGELALAGVDVALVERRASQALDGSRAGGLHARSIEVLDQRGIAGRFLAEGRVMQLQGFAGIGVDISDFPSRHPYGLALGQGHIERILAGWVEELGVSIQRRCEVVGLAEDAEGVEVSLAGGGRLRGAYVVGCDGGRSVVRKAAGIGFVGVAASTSWVIAEVEMDEAPPVGMRPEGGGIGPVEPGGGGLYRVVLMEPAVGAARDAGLDDVRGALVAVYGTDFGLRSARWVSRFTDMARQAEVYRRGRVLVAGDAAHVHPPHGGQGLNTGVQDAVNLGWKLAQVVGGVSPASLLDTYHAERHPVGARVLDNTMAAVALSSADVRRQALKAVVAAHLAMDEPRRQMGGLLSGLDVHYDLGGGHPLVGRRMPDLELETAEGVTRVYALLQAARGLLIGFAGVGGSARWSDRVRWVAAAYSGGWALPVIGEVAAPPAVLVRPDGYVAWVGELSDPALGGVITRWLGEGGGA